MSTNYDDVWENITFPFEDHSSEELSDYLQEITDWIIENKPKKEDIEMHFDTSNWDDFCEKYPNLIDVWRDKIEAALP